jgi:hypothetical protein
VRWLLSTARPVLARFFPVSPLVDWIQRRTVVSSLVATQSFRGFTRREERLAAYREGGTAMPLEVPSAMPRSLVVAREDPLQGECNE